MATELTYLPHLKTDAEHKAEEGQSEHQQKLRDAAPELLEALEAIVAFDTPLPCGLLKQARAAIAKAKP